jgi:endo-1,4-beta-xylanase
MSKKVCGRAYALPHTFLDIFSQPWAEQPHCLILLMSYYNSGMIFAFRVNWIGLVLLWLSLAACSQKGISGTATEIDPGQKPAFASPSPPVLQPSNPMKEPDRQLEPMSLRQLAEQRGLYVGAAVQVKALQDQDYAGLLAREFNLVVPEIAMTFRSTQPGRDRYDFSQGDELVAFAREHGMAVRGQVLVWDHQLPDWLVQGEFSQAEWMQLLKEHIQTKVGHYRGQIVAWDVVNEAIDDEGLLRNTIWMQNIGPEYIALAFWWAREADPEVLLFYNDHLGEGLNRKSQAIFALVSGLLNAGVPIDGVGMQMHTWLEGPPEPEAMAANMQRLADLGLLVQITEMDVRTQYHSISDEEKLVLQAKMYRQVIETCLAAGNCNAFITWGVTDRYSWIPGYTGSPDMPLLFDLEGRPKPAYEAVRQALMER